LVRAVIDELRRQIVDNVQLTTNTDFGDGVVDAAVLAKLPGLVLIGPDVRENRFFSENKSRQTPLTDGFSRDMRPAFTVDLVFTLVGVDDNTITTLNLHHEVG